MIVPTLEVAHIAAAVNKISDAVVDVMDNLLAQNVHICDLGFEDVLKPLDEIKAILEAVVAENSGGEHAKTH